MDQHNIDSSSSFSKNHDKNIELYQNQPQYKAFYLNVEGMSWSSCEANLTKKTIGINGVISAQFSALTKLARIEIDVNVISIREVLKIINTGKYTVELKHKSDKLDIRQSIQNESKAKRARLLNSLLLWIPILICIWIVPYTYPLKDYIWRISQPNGPTLYVYVTATFSIWMQFYLGSPLYYSAYVALKSCSSNMDTLVVIGTSASIFYGILLFFLGYGELKDQTDDDSQYRMKIIEHAHMFEVSSTILFIICIGKYLEAYARSKTVQKLSDLASIKVSKAILFTPNDEEHIDFSGKEEEIPIELLNKNDLVKVINGQIIPTDCVVVYGNGFCDESMLTGESKPVHKLKGFKVYGGTLLQKGSLILRAEAIEEESSLNQILRLVENAQTNKAPIQAYADRISSIFVPIIIILSLIAWWIWFTVVFSYPSYFDDMKESKFNFAFKFGISTVVIACPWALGLATPTVVMVCSGVAANLGILIKGGNILEKASKVDTVVFDKTGTLTEGNPEVVKIEILSEKFSQKEIYYLTSVWESESEHPLGRAIANEFMDKIPEDEADELNLEYKMLDFSNFNGEGISCNFEYSKENINFAKDNTFNVLIGNEKLMQRKGVICDNATYTRIDKLEAQGWTVVQMAINKEIMCLISLQEKHLTKTEAREVVSYLKYNNCEVHMITGDNESAARKVASALDIPLENVLFRASPENKKTRVQQLQKAGKKVMFIGDGVNDSPVLAQSDVGVAFNTQSDITVEAADVVVIKDSLISVIDIIRLTKSAFRRIKINFFWAFVYNIILIPIAMGALYPIIGFRLSPHLAALAMALSSISVVLSSLMLKLYKRY